MTDGYLQEVLRKQKPTIVVNVRVPVLELERKMALPCSCSGSDALERIMRRAAVQNMERLGMYLPATGVWAEPGRPLSSYLLADEDKIDVLFRPEQQNPCVVVVRNTLTGQQERVPIDDHTTIFGMVQAVEKPEPAAVAQSGIRIRTAAGSFFCEPARLCTDYQVGLAIKVVEYGVVQPGEQFVQPQGAPLDQAQPLLAALTSPNANADGIAQLTQKLAEAQRVLQVLQSRAGHSSAARANATAAPQKLSLQPRLLPPTQLPSPTQPVQPQVRRQVKVQLQPKLQQQQQQQRRPRVEDYGVVPQYLDVPAKATASGDVLYGVRVEEAADVPPAGDDVVGSAQWLAEAVYLGTWWNSITEEQRHHPDNMGRARALVRNLFGTTTESQKSALMELVAGGAVNKDQLAGIVRCLSDVSAQ